MPPPKTSPTTQQPVSPRNSTYPYLTASNILVFGCGGLIGFSVPMFVLLLATLFSSRSIPSNIETAVADPVPASSLDSASVNSKESTKVATEGTKAPSPSVDATKSYKATDLKNVGKQTKAVFYALPDLSRGFAYEPVEGKFAITSDKEGLLVYDVDEVLAGNQSASVRPLKGFPNQICFKQFEQQSYFVVASLDAPILQLFNAKTLEPASDIELEGVPGVASVAVSSNPQDPFIYFTCIGKGNSPWSQQLGRFDMRTRKLQGPTKRIVTDVSVSRDGQFVFANGIPLLDVDSAFNGLCRLAVEDPSGRPSFFGGFSGQQHRDLEPGIGSSLANVHFKGLQEVFPEFAFTAKPVLVGWMDSSICLFSSGPPDTANNKPLENTRSPNLREIEKISLPSSWMTSSPRQSAVPDNRMPPSKSIVGDDQRGLIFAFVNSNLAIVNVPEMANKSNKAPAYVRHPMPTIVELGSTIEFELEGLPDTEVEIVSYKSMPASGSENIKINMSRFGKWIEPEHEDKPALSSRKFRWTPSLNQLGKFEVRFRSGAGNEIREWNWQTHVVSPSISPGFHAVAMNCNQDGSKAVVWGTSHIETDTGPGNVPKIPYKYFVAMYDLKEKQVLQLVEVDGPVYSAAIDDSSIYVCVSESNPAYARVDQPSIVKRYDLKSGKVAAERRLEKHQQLSIVGKYLLTNGNAFECESLNKVSRYASFAIHPRFLASAVGEKLVLDGVLWDATKTTPQLLCNFLAPGLPEFNTPFMNVFGSQVQFRHGGPYLFDWNSNYLADTFPGGASACHYSLQFAEVFAAINGGIQVYDPSIAASMGDPNPRISQSGAFGGMGGPELNPRTPSPGFRILPVGPAAGPLASTADKIYSVGGGRIYEFPIDTFIKNRKPFRLEEKQSTFVVPYGRSTEIRYSAPGATNYSLYVVLDRMSLMPGESDLQKLESNTGQFKLHLTNKEVLRSLVCKVIGTSATEPDPKALKAYRDRLLPEIARITKTQILGIPLPISVAVLAQRDNETACLAHEFIVDIPMVVFANKPAKGK